MNLLIFFTTLFLGNRTTYVDFKVQQKSLELPQLQQQPWQQNAEKIRYQEEWLLYKKKYFKYYDDIEEDYGRFLIFVDNSKLIEDHNQLYKRGLSTYELGHNEFSDLTHEEFLEQYTTFTKSTSNSKSEKNDEPTVKYDPTVRDDPTVRNDPTLRYDRINNHPTVRYEPIERQDPTVRQRPIVRYYPKVRYHAELHQPSVRYDPTVRQDPTVRYYPRIRYDAEFHHPTVRYDPTVGDEPTVRQQPTVRYDPTVRTEEDYDSMEDSHQRSKNDDYLDFLGPSNVQLPVTIDWRKIGAVTPIKNQGSCKASWLFSAVGAIESQIFRKIHNLTILSEQNILDCSNRYGNNGCHYGTVSNSLHYVLDNEGINTAKSYPWYGKKCWFCHYERHPSNAQIRQIVKVETGNETALQSAVATVGPVSVGVDASSRTFQFYKSGVYINLNCTRYNLNHNMLVVGYGRFYWIVKNSFGRNWGEKGYIRMSKGRGNQCGIATRALYPLV